MANHKSAAKRARQTERKTNRNRRNISAVRTAIKKFYAAIEEGKDAATVAGLLKATQSLVAKAATKGLFHPNKAYRTISRLTKASVKTSDSLTKAAPAKKTKKTEKKTATTKASATKKKTTKKKTTKKK